MSLRKPNSAALIVRRWLPFFDWPQASRATWIADSRAGLTVALVLVPQALAYAILAGLPAVTGLYAAVLPVMVAALWGASPVVASGPVAMTSMLTAASLQGMAEPGSAHSVACAVWLAIYSGLMQWAIGLLGLGQLTSFVSQPTLLGFIHAVALVIGGSQLGTLLAWPRGLGILDAIQGVANQGDEISWPMVFESSALGFVSLLMLYGLRRYWPRQPYVVYTVVVVTALAIATGFSGRGGAVLGAMRVELPSLGALPRLSWAEHRALLPLALIIALVSFAEVMSSAKVFSRLRGERWDQNQELIGQGLAKVASGLCGAFPISGSLSRSALNHQVGAKSLRAGVLTGIFAAVIIGLSLPWLALVPRSVMAAIILFAVVNLVDLPAWRRLWAISREEMWVALITMVATLASAPQMQWGLLLGLILAIALMLYRRSQPRIVEVAVHSDGALRDRLRFPNPRLAPDVVVVRMDAQLAFFSVDAFEAVIRTWIETDGVRTVVILGSGINAIDASGVETLLSLIRDARSRHVRIQLAAIKQQVLTRLDAGGLRALLSDADLYSSEASLIAHYRQGVAAD